MNRSSRAESTTAPTFPFAQLLKASISLLLLALVLRNMSSTQVLELVARIRVARLPAIIGVFLIAQAIYAAALQQLTVAMGHSAGFRQILANHYKGLFWASFLPSTMGGDVYRVVDLGRIIGSRPHALAAIVAQRGLAMALALLTAAVTLPLLTDFRLSASTVTAPSISPFITVVAVLGITVLVVFLLVIKDRLGAIGAKFKALLLELVVTLTSLRRSTGLVVILLLLLSQAVVVTGVYMLSNTLGIEVALWHFFYVVPLVLIATAIPITINGIGIREGAFTVMLGFHSVAPTQAAALGALLTLFSLLYAIIGCTLFVFSKERFS